MNLKNKVVLVTGSSSGIGEATATAFAHEGAKVLVHYRNNKKGAEKTLVEVGKYSSGKIYQADLSELSQVRNLFKKIRKDYQIIDILVNNAADSRLGVAGDYKMWKFEWQNVFMSSVITTNAFLAFSRGKGLRKIINISSLYGEFYSGNPRFIQYSAVKSAVNSWTMNLAKTLSPRILVNGVAPGWTWTPAWEGTSKKRKHEIEQRTQIKRFIEPVEVADAVIFLAKNDAVTGEILHVDGGVRLVDLP